MKVIQLGCGITGLVSAEHLEKTPYVSELVLADAVTDSAERLSERLGSDKVSVVKVDATDPSSLRKLLDGADLVISAIPWQLNKAVVDMALTTGTSYIDFSMPVDKIEDFEDMDRRSRDVGVTVLTSMGADPGISDIFARYAADKLDRAVSARVMDGDTAVADGYDFFSLWSPLEMLEEVTSPAAVFRDGEMTYLPPLHERQVYEFPDPVGPLPIYNTLHEETFLMSRFIEGLEYADFRIAVDDEFARVAKVLRRIGMHSLKPIDVKGSKVRPLDVVVALMPRPVDLVGKVRGYAGLVVEVRGQKDGVDKLVRVWTTMSHEEAFQICGNNATGYFVGTGGAVAGEMLLSGEVDARGVLVPEQLPAEKFIARLPDKKLVVKEEVLDV
jgi:saccharopine dehydrogenase (NAD+, L-lysine-forming)